MISLIQANRLDADEASRILNEVADWLNERGMPLWQASALSPDVMQTHAAQNELFLALVGQERAGTLILQETDPLFWPEMTGDDSLFFHKLAVRRKFAGLGVSSALIEFAYEQAQERGKSFLRMDCSALHPALRVFYESKGFLFVDQRYVGERLVNRLYKPVF